MHPMIARIHPSIRTAFGAWIVARVIVCVGWINAGNVAPHIDPRGTPTWSWFVELSYYTHLTEWIWFALIELTIPLALIATYKFARRDTLPQGAEHATWLVAFAPAMALLPPGESWTLGIGLALISLGGLINGSFIIAGICLSIAMAVLPETIFVLPAFSAIGWKTTNDSGTKGIWVPIFGLATFSVVILYPVFLGDPSFFVDGLQRRNDWQTLLNEPVMFIGLASCFCITVLGAYRTRTYRWLWFAPIALVPMLFEPTGSGLAIVMLAAPAIATSLTVISEDLAFQRFTLMLCAVGLMTLAYA